MTGLQTRVLGRTGPEVMVLGFGAIELRGAAGGRGRLVSGSDASANLNGVVDAGINFIDTSPDDGESEEGIGRYIDDADLVTLLDVMTRSEKLPIFPRPVGLPGTEP